MENTLSEKPRRATHHIEISTKDNPDLEYYDVDDDISLSLSGKVSGKYMIGEGKDRYMMVNAEMDTCHIIHKGDKRKQVEMGVDKKIYDKMKSKKMV